MSDFNLGRHEALIEGLNERVCNVEKMVKGFDAKLDTVVIALAERRGERRAAAYIAGLAATVVSLIVTLIARWVHP